MKTITFISRYNNTRVNVRLSDENASEVLHHRHGYTAIELYNNDCFRIANGWEPLYFSKSQIKRLKTSIVGVDYFVDVEMK